MGLVVVVLTVLTSGVSGRNVTLQRAMLRYVNVTLTDVVIKPLRSVRFIPLHNITCNDVSFSCLIIYTNIIHYADLLIWKAILGDNC